MSTQAAGGLSSRRSTVVLAVLFTAAFIVGSAELVVVGILDLVARGLAVSIPAGGALVTVYAVGIAVGGPALTAATMRFGRRPVLLSALGAYIVGNVLAATAATFGMLLVARAVTGALHGVFIGVAFTVAAAVVPPERMGRAISVVFGGIAVSTALGVPLGTLIGQQLGWRASFVAIVVLGAIALGAAVATVPVVRTTGASGLRAQARHALAPRVLAVLGLGLLVMGGQFAALTFITPFLTRVTGVSEGMTSVFLLAYGAANAIGTFAGGRAADWNARRTLPLAVVVLVADLAALYWFGSVPAVAILALVGWGLVGFGLVPSLQYRVTSLAGPGRDLAATLPASAVTLGIAIGSVLGGWALSAGGPSAPVLVALAMCSAALPVAWATGRLRVPTAPEDATIAPCVTAS
jgi:MFS transporter, DHA1 family, inner membrane transport protein